MTPIKQKSYLLPHNEVDINIFRSEMSVQGVTHPSLLLAGRQRRHRAMKSPTLQQKQRHHPISNVIYMYYF